MRDLRSWLSTITMFAVLFGVIFLLERHNSKEYLGRAIVVDGDSILLNGKQFRLSGIDAPELDQPCKLGGKDWSCGRASKRALSKRLQNQNISCVSSSVDKYDRHLAVCGTNNGEVNSWMVSNGWAVDYGGYGREEAIAREKRVGIWQGEFGIPEKWRRLKTDRSSDFN